MVTIKEIIELYQQELAKSYPKSEIVGFLRILFEEVLNMTPIHVSLNKNSLVDKDKALKFYGILERLKKQEPLQYVLGSTYFYDLKLNVNQLTLIPRQETEELVQWIVNDAKHKNLSYLDIGAGSGCIAIAIAKNVSAKKVTAIDISMGALQLAQENAKKHEANVEFKQLNILEETSWQELGSYDAIVSNPPYVRNSEQKYMRANVLNYEPREALFVNDSDPLLFYSKIASFAKEKLNENGCLYFEINEAFGNEMIALLKNNQFKNIKLRKDIHGKPRMIKAQK